MKKLDLKDWAAIAEIAGTIAVVISLAFVIVSIRQNTAALHAANESVLYDLNDRFWSDRINNSEVYESWEELMAGEPLSVSAEGQIYDFVLRAMNVWENMYVKHKSGQLSHEQFDNWHESNSEWVKRRVPKSMWDQMRGPHWRLDFEDQIDAIYAED